MDCYLLDKIFGQCYTGGKKEKLFQGGTSEVREGKARNASKGSLKEEWFPWGKINIYEK